MAEAVDWQEKYFSYLEGDLQKDIRKLEDGQKGLGERLHNDIKALDEKIDRVAKDLGGKIDRILYIVAGAALVALIGGLIGGLTKMLVK